MEIMEYQNNAIITGELGGVVPITFCCTKNESEAESQMKKMENVKETEGANNGAVIPTKTDMESREQESQEETKDMDEAENVTMKEGANGERKLYGAENKMKESAHSVHGSTDFDDDLSAISDMNMNSNEDKINHKADCNDGDEPDFVSVSDTDESPPPASGRNSPCVYVTLEDMMQMTRMCRIVLRRCDQKCNLSQKGHQQGNVLESADNVKNKKYDQRKQSHQAPGAKSSTHAGVMRKLTKTSSVKTKTASLPRKEKKRKKQSSSNIGGNNEDSMNPHFEERRDVIVEADGVQATSQLKRDDLLAFAEKEPQKIEWKARGRGRPPLGAITVLSEAEIQAIRSPAQLIRQVSSGRLLCVLCQRMFPTITRMVVHLRSHTGERPYRCRKCLKTFKQQNQLLLHAEKNHLLVYEKDQVDYFPGRLEILAKSAPRKRVVRKTINVRRSNALFRPRARVLFPEKDGPPENDPFKDDIELLDVMNNNDENDNEIELVYSEEMKAFIKDRNERYRKPQFIEMKHPETNTMVEVDRNLLSLFVQPFLDKCGLSQTSGENLSEVHSRLRNVLGIQNPVNNSTALSPSRQKRSWKRRMIYSCEKCELKFSSKQQLHTHIRHIHDRSVEDRPYTCLVCWKMFKNKFNLSAHIREVHNHSGERRFKCGECDSSFKHARSLRSHFLGNHDRLKVDSGNRRFKCGECGRSFMLKKNLQYHLTEHTGDLKKQMLACPTCGLFFVSDENLQAHELTHGIEPGFTETTVNSQTLNFKTVDDLILKAKRKRLTKLRKSLPDRSTDYKAENSNGPLSLSSPVKDIKRPIIGRSSLEMLCPSSELKSFKCHSCGSLFSKKPTLDYHMRIHSGKKPFKCQKCDLRFVYEQNLKAHMKVHAGDCKQKCHICNVAYKTVKALQCHEKRCHPETLIKKKGKIRSSTNVILEESSSEAHKDGS